MIGGVALGLVETMNDAYFTAGYRDLVIFSIFFVFLVFRPEGLFAVRRES
jgi:branched-subunit amino acid ABC-type transport system permease component